MIVQYGIFCVVLLAVVTILVGLFIYLSKNVFFKEIDNKYIYLATFLSFITWFSQILFKISDAYAYTVKTELMKIFHRLLLFFSIFFLFSFDKLILDTYYWVQSFLIIIMCASIISFLFKKDIIVFNDAIFSIKGVIKEYFIFCSPLFVFSSIALLITLFDVWFLNKFGGVEQSGFYGLSYSIAAICFLFTGAMTPLITREFSKNIQDKNISRVRTIYRTYTPILYLLSSFMGVFIFVNSEEFVLLFAGEGFFEASLALSIMAFYPIHQTYGQINASLMYAQENTKLLSRLGIINSIFGGFLTILFVYALDLQSSGLAMKMVIFQFVGVNVQLFYNSKFLKISFIRDIAYQIWVVLILLVIGMISKFALSYIIDLQKVKLGIIANLFGSGFIYTSLVGFLLILKSNIFNIEQVTFLRKRTV